MTATGEPVVRLSRVSHGFGDERGLTGIELAVERGSIFGLVGPSGSGKTTIVRLVLGLMAPAEGQVAVFERPATELDGAERSRIGYLPQLSALYPELTLRHNLDLAASLYGMPWRPRFPVGRRGRAARRRVEEALAFVDLTDHQRTRLGDASGGERRRLGLAAAVVHEPDLLVLDEPTAGIDPVLRRRIWDRLATLRAQGVTVFVTTQYVEEVARCDVVALLVDGCLVAVDTPDTLRAVADAHNGGQPVETLEDVFVTLVRRQRGEVGRPEDA